MSDEKALALIDSVSEDTHPLHRMLFRVADNIDFEAQLEDWASENTGAYLRILMELAPRPGAARPSGSGGGFHMHLHPSLHPGPLDAPAAGQVIDHSDD